MREWLRRPVVLGTIAAVATALVGVTTVLVVADAVDGDDASAARTPEVTAAARDRSDARRSTTTTTRAGGTTTTTRAGGSGGTLPATGGTAPPVLEPDPPDTTPDPPDPGDAFQPGPVAPGISVSISSCSWSPAAGGTLRATGTMTYNGPEDTFWLLEISWLYDNQGQTEELDSDFEVYDLVNGQTVSWELSTTTEQPTPPTNLRCAYAVS